MVKEIVKQFEIGSGGLKIYFNKFLFFPLIRKKIKNLEKKENLVNQKKKNIYNRKNLKFDKVYFAMPRTVPKVT